ncbi:MAG: lytic transglycosylase domain-containing protein [Actinomycetota bacterium]|nr:lytic transglycosylase domain-containing protein [Actinomycetota bacterium]
MHRRMPATSGPRARRTVATLFGVAVTTTTLVVSTGLFTAHPASVNGGAVLSASAQRGQYRRLSATELADRQRSATGAGATSRSAPDRMAQAAKLKSQQLSDASGKAVTKSVDLTQADPRTIARALLPQFGFSPGEFSCLDSLWVGESGWNIHAANPTSSAYGIPQALPGSKMATAGPDWVNNPETQIRWGLGYIRNSYGSPCGAWSFKQGHGWY